MEKQWIVLTRDQGSAGFKQLGPISTMDVKRLLESSQVSSHDFIWSQGFESWLSISSVSEFFEESAYAQSKDQQLSFDFGGESIPTKNIPPASIVSSKRTKNKAQAHAKSNRVLHLSLFIFLLAVGFGAFLNWEIRESKKAVSVASFNDDLLKVGPFRMKFVDLDKEEGRIEFVGKFNAQDKIKIKVEAVKGEVLGYATFEKLKDVENDAEDIPFVTLKEIGVTPGKYQIEATLNGSDQVKSQFFVGENNKEFKELLEVHNRKLRDQEKYEATKISEIKNKMLNRLVDLKYRAKKAAIDNKYIDNWLISSRELLSKDIKELKQRSQFNVEDVQGIAQIQGRSISYVQSLKRQMNSIRSNNERRKLVQNASEPDSLIHELSKIYKEE